MDFFGLAREIEALSERAAGPAAPGERAAVLVRLAWYLRQRDAPAAASHLAEAAALLDAGAGPEQPPPAVLRARLTLVRAEERWLCAALDEAEAILAEALAGFEAAGDPTGAGDARLLGASIARDRGDGERRMALLLEARADYAQASDILRLRIVEAWLANDAVFVDPAVARERAEALEQALATEPHPGLVAVICAVLAPAAFQRGEFGRAATLYQRGFSAAFEAGQLRSAIVMGANVAAAFSNLNDFTAALEWGERMLALARPTGWPAIVATALIQVADPLRGMGRFETSRQVLSEGLEVLKPLRQSSIWASATKYLGDLSLALDDHEAALCWFAEAETLARTLGRTDLVGQTLRGRASALARLDRLDEALDCAGTALSIARGEREPLAEIDALRAVAEIRRRRAGPPAEILATLRQALEIAAGIAGFATPGTLLSELAEAAAAAGDFAAAYDYERRAAAAGEQIRTREAEARAIAAQVRLETERAQADATRQRAVAEAERRRAQGLQEANETLARLGTIGQEITAELTEEAVFEALYRHAGRLVPMTSLSVYLLNAAGDALVLRFGREEGARLPDRTIPLDHPSAFSARCARTREEIVVGHGPAADQRSLVFPGTLESQSLMFAPLLAGDRLIGVLTIQSTETDAYGERERSIFHTLCAYGAIALANAAAMAELKAAEVELKRHMQVLERLATIDALTNIANRHGFLTRAAEEIARSRRHARPLGLVMFDLDHFKRVNDDWGHAVGDEVLRQIAAAVDASIRPEDFLARIGGEEFVVLLPGTDRAAALRAAGRLRQTVEATEIRHDGGTLRITASFGTSVLAPEDGSIDALLSRADNALYRAKEGGRNQVRTEFPG